MPLIRGVFVALGGSRLLILARWLADVVRRGSGLVLGILLGRALLVRIIVRVVIVRRHYGSIYGICSASSTAMPLFLKASMESLEPRAEVAAKGVIDGCCVIIALL